MDNLRPPPSKVLRSRDWLRFLDNGNPNWETWLLPYEEELRGVIRRELNQPPEFHHAFKLLMRIIPFFVLTLTHTKLWMPLLLHALMPSLQLKDERLRMEIYRWWGETNLQVGKPEAARQSFAIALEFAAKDEHDAMMVAAYTGLFRLQWFREQDSFTPELVQTAMKFAQRVSDAELRAGLHDALVYAYMRILDMPSALEHAQMACIHQFNGGTTGAIGQSLFTLAAVHRNAAWYCDEAHLGERARLLLVRAREYMPKTKRESLSTLLAYEEGLQYFQLQAYPKAVEWLQTALDEALNSGREHYVAASRHALGLAQTKTEHYVDARRNLVAAAGIWNKMQNQFERANAFYALGHLEILDQRRQLGLDYLQLAMTICKELAHDAQVEYLRKRIQDTLDDIDKKS